MKYFCTLFDINYIEKGVALWSSLMAHGGEFTLYILALDDASYWLLNEMRLENVIVLNLPGVESTLKLEPVRANRSWLEYCWTLASQLMEYLMRTTYVDVLTYLDADLYFFSNPEPIFAEIGTASIGIIPHRFYRGNMRLIVNGVYNVGWLTIKRTVVGMECLLKWARQCREWCYHRNEGFLFGDQGYLNSWPYDYGAGCHVITNNGAGLAPWNVMRYNIYLVLDHGKPMLYVEFQDKLGLASQLIFYHFHEFIHDSSGNPIRLTRHPHNNNHKEFIYNPYIQAIRAAAKHVQHLRLKQQSERT